jgi:hypothetical protein
MPLSSVWYDACVIDLTGADSETDVDTVLLDAIRTKADEIASQADDSLLYVSLRLRLVGQTAIAARISEMADRMCDDLGLSAGHATIAIEKVAVETTPPIDLQEHAKTQSAPGALARLLLELDKPEVSAEVAELIRHTRQAISQADGQKVFAPLDKREVAEDRARDHLRTQARALLTQLVNQSS